MSAMFYPIAIDLLNKVKAWRDCAGNDGFPRDVREQMDSLLMAVDVVMMGTLAERMKSPETAPLPSPDIAQLTEQAQAWEAVCVALNQAKPDWHWAAGPTGLDKAVAAIHALATQKSKPVLAEPAGGNFCRNCGGAMHQLHRCQVMRDGHFEAMAAAEVESETTRIKQFLLGQEDRYRPPYGTQLVKQAAEASPTAAMTIEQRILHVGGRNNAASYVEFGSTQAVQALVRQVLRDQPHLEPSGVLIESEAFNLEIRLGLAFANLGLIRANNLSLNDKAALSLARKAICDVIPVVANMAPLTTLTENLDALLDRAHREHQVITVDLIPREPYAMGSYSMCGSIRPGRVS